MNRSAWNDHEVSGHVSLDEIADAAEDLLDPDRAAAIDAHLRGCADCRSQADALAAVTARLAAAPRSAMPPSVARALQAAVAGQPAEAGRTPIVPRLSVPARRFRRHIALTLLFNDAACLNESHRFPPRECMVDDPLRLSR